MRAILADRGSLGHAAGGDIDYGKLRLALAGDICHVFVSSKEPGVAQGVTVEHLRRAGWQVHQFDPMPAADGRPRAYPEVDMALCAMCDLPSDVKEVVLVTGANAAAAIARRLREAGMRVLAASFSASIGGELRRQVSVDAGGVPSVIYLDATDIFAAPKKGARA